jgi:hypothetical protein
LISPPIIVAPLYQCATAVTIIGYWPQARLDVQVDGVMVINDAPGGFPMPNGATLPLLVPLVAGQKVRARQRTSTATSNWSPEVTVGDHTRLPDRSAAAGDQSGAGIPLRVTHRRQQPTDGLQCLDPRRRSRSGSREWRGRTPGHERESRLRCQPKCAGIRPRCVRVLARRPSSTRPRNHPRRCRPPSSKRSLMAAVR